MSAILGRIGVRFQVLKIPGVHGKREGMKAITYTFWSVVALIGVTFVMSVVTAVRQEKTQAEVSQTIPVPAQ
jgi:hypothetical protein